MLDDNRPRSGWPPYDIEKNGEDRYCIGMAVAGFGWEEIDVTQQGNTLIVMGQKADQGPRHLENGILAIDLFARSLKR
jgi:molecular chaperone IbpA